MVNWNGKKKRNNNQNTKNDIHLTLFDAIVEREWAQQTEVENGQIECGTNIYF